jgi:hypothetical protein
MIYNRSEYNPFPAIKEAAKETKREDYGPAFYDYIRKQLFMGGVVPESEEEFSEILVVLLNMDII